MPTPSSLLALQQLDSAIKDLERAEHSTSASGELTAEEQWLFQLTQHQLAKLRERLVERSHQLRNRQHDCE